MPLLTTYNLMKKIILYIVYGDDQTFYRSAKFSILNLLNFTDNADIDIVVLSENIKEFKDFPVTTIEVTKQKLNDWSFDGKYHFRIKNLGLHYILKILGLSKNDKILFFDADVYFKKSPLMLFDLITDTQIVMYKNEGRIHKKKRFDYYKSSLKGKLIQYKKDGDYTLNSNSEMWGSAIIGVPALAYHSIQDADLLMSSLLKILDIDKAHTIEQFSLVEILRKEFKVIEGKKYISIFSTSGKKYFALKKINNFLKENNHLDIESLSEKSLGVNIERSIFQIIKYKLLQ
jgi:heptosyltransferase-3